jgi:hypothetical protein
MPARRDLDGLARRIHSAAKIPLSVSVFRNLQEIAIFGSMQSQLFLPLLMKTASFEDEHAGNHHDHKCRNPCGEQLVVNLEVRNPDKKETESTNGTGRSDRSFE